MMKGEVPMRFHKFLSAAITVAMGLTACASEENPAQPSSGTAPVRAVLRSDAQVQTTRAVVIHHSSCALLDGSGGFVSSTESNKVGTPSGVARYSCHAKRVPGATGRAIHYDSQNNPVEVDLVCGIELPSGLFLTTDWNETISATGNATLICRVPQGSEPTEPF
jgi:hypothetical protein